MNSCEKILNIAQNNNGYITTNMVEENNIARRYLYILTNKNKLEKVERGIYSLPNVLKDMYFCLQKKSKYVVFSHMTALFFYNLSDRMPHLIDLTVTDTYRGTLQNEENINLFRVKKENINLGITQVESPLGNKIKIYNLERSICDIVRNKEKMELELFNKAIRGYFNNKNKDMVKLMDYAKKLNIEKEVVKAFEVLT